MRAFFWSMFLVNATFAGLVALALPHGENFVYAAMAGTQLGMLALLARARVEAPKEWDHSSD